MSEVSVEVGFPLDSSGFLRRECPYCKREFKIHQDDFPRQPDEIYCPCCGQTASPQEFYTEEQIDYMRATLVKTVVGPELDRFTRDLQNIGRRSGGLVSMTATHNPAPEPSILPDEDDLYKMEFGCCNLRVKVESPDGAYHCLFCGSVNSVES